MALDSIRLGVMPPLTGLVEIYGQDISLAAQIACQEVNENGGVLGRPLELIIEDDGSLPQSAVVAAQKLVQQHQCVAIIGNLLSNSRIAVAYRVAEPLKIPYLNFSFYEGSISSRYFFHFAALPNQQIDLMIPYMLKTYGPRMFFAGNNYEWPRGSIAAAIEILTLSGGKQVGKEFYPINVDQRDIDILLDHLEESEADVFVPYFAGIDQVNLLTSFTARGLKKRFAVVMGHYDETMASQLSPDVREGFYSSNTYFMSVDTEENQRYKEKLRTMPGITGVWPRGNGTLSNFGEGTYLCVKAFAAAANKANSIESEVLVKALETVSVIAPQGKVQMEPVTHHAQVNSYLSRCQADGTFKIIESFGPISPVIPKRYRHMQINPEAHVEEDIRLQARIIEQIEDAIILVGAFEGTVVFSNRGASKTLGFGSEELEGKRFDELFLTSDERPDKMLTIIGDSIYREGVWTGDIETFGKNGSSFWWSISGTAFTHSEYGEVWMLVFRDITKRKQNEEKLQHASLIIEKSPVVLFQWNATREGWPVEHVSDNVTQFGYTAEELLSGQTLYASIIHPDDLDRVAREVQEYSASGVSHFNQEYRIVSPNGDVHWTDDRTSIERDADGNTTHYIGTVIDITDRKRVEESLHESEEKFRKYYELGSIGMVTSSPEKRWLQVNNRFCQIVEYPREELMQMTWTEITHPDDLAAEAIQFDRVVSGEIEGYSMDKRFVRKNGEVVHVSLSTTCIRKEDGSIDSFLAFLSDITERKNVEAELLENTTILTKAQDIAHLGSWKLNVDTLEVEGSKELQKLFALDNDKLSIDDFVKIIHPDDRQYNLTHIQNGIEHGLPWSIEYRLLLRDGEVRWVHAMGEPLLDNEGEVDTIVGVVQDITVSRQAQEELEKHREHLEELVTERTQELEEKNIQLDRTMKVFVGREVKIRELENRIRMIEAEE